MCFGDMCWRWNSGDQELHFAPSPVGVMGRIEFEHNTVVETSATDCGEAAPYATP